MKLLEDRILQDGTVLPNNILKVDNFLNHQIDPQLMLAMGRDFANHFADKGINKILTIEISGIAVAMAAAIYLNVPLVFAKKTASVTLAADLYTAKVTSYTKKTEYTIRVDKKFFTANDNVLIIDDFLATGEALRGMTSICQQAGAKIVGFGIAIEKVFQNGGDYFRKLGYDVYSQAMIENFVNNTVKFKDR